MKRILKYYIWVLVTVLFFAVFMPEKEADAAYKFKYKDYSIGKTVNYNGVVPSYVIDGVEAELSEQPAIISERGIAYASAKGLFRDNMDVSVTYNKAKKRVTFKYKGHVLKMFVGETRAIFDGEEILAPCAPFRIKYKKGKIYATMVPTRFVAETLGMEYAWNSETSTVTITIPFYYELNGESHRYTGTKGKITFEGENVELYDAPSLILSDTAMINSGSELFNMAGVDFDYDEDTGIINLAYRENSLVYCVGSKIVYINGLLNRCSFEPTLFYIDDVDEDVLYLPGRFTMENLGFNYVWNSDTGTSEVSIIQDENEPEDENENEIENETETNADSQTESDTDAQPVSDTDSEIGSSDSAVVLPLELINVYNTIEGYKFFIDRDNCVQTMSLPVPKGVGAKDMDMKEELLSCLTELVIKGDHRDFYKDTEVLNTGEAILQIQVYYDPNNDETLIRLFSDIVIGCGVSDIDEGLVQVRMDFVKNIYKKVIVMDAGHGAHDPGAQAHGYNESDLNLRIVLNCRELFKNSDVKVYFTRIDDSFLTLYDRADFAELVGADMFIAVHHNSSWYTDVTGTSVYYGDQDTYTSLGGLTSETLAWKMLDNLTEALGTKVFATGVINKNFVVVRDSKAPAVLLEIGFMSNDDELNRIVTDEFSKTAAKAIYDTVIGIYKDAE